MHSRSLAALAAALLVSNGANALEEVTFGTNWVAQAEHGGFYQALADGTYEECGLNVEILPGGPQVNNRALLAAGKIDFYLGGDLLRAFDSVLNGIPVVLVAAIFQKHPQVILAHPGKAERFEDLRNLTLMIAEFGYQSYYKWMIAEYGFSDEQRVPYMFNPTPFLADENKAMQGYLTSEPYSIEREGGFRPDVFLLADEGYSTYSTTIETMADTVASKPEVVQCFVDGSIKGWYAYLYGNRTAADDLIKKHNPEMTDDRIDYAVEMMVERGIADSGLALQKGIGVIDETIIEDFYGKMVAAGVVPAELDWRSTFTSEFTGRGVGMELKPE